MNSSALEPLAKKLRFDSEHMWIDFQDGRVLGIPLAYFPRLINATPKQRRNYIISSGGRGIHWEELNEDLSVAGLLLGKWDITTSNSRDHKIA